MQRALSLPGNGELILEGGCSVCAWVWAHMVMSQGTNRRTRPRTGLGVPAGCSPFPGGSFRKLRRDVNGAEGDMAAAAGLETCQVRRK